MNLSINNASYSFVIPIYNDGYLVESFCEAINEEMKSLFNVSDISRKVEVIFVNDGSSDESQQQLETAAIRYGFVKVVELSRNFGQHIAISCGYRLAAGDYVGMMNVDMQDPPDQIALLLKELASDTCDIVIGLRKSRKDKLMERVTSLMFNYVLNWLTGARTPINTASLRIMNRRFVDAYNTLSDKVPYIPGLEHWLGFRHSWVTIRHNERISGKSSYSFGKRLRMAGESILGFSDLPLRFAALLGTVITMLGCILTVGLFVRRIVFANLLGGYTSTIAVIVILGGTNLLFMGLIGLYLGRVLHEVQGRPRYVIKSLHNFDTETCDRKPLSRSERQ
jgi:dolichol-phosphate mannosyltransferase